MCKLAHVIMETKLLPIEVLHCVNSKSEPFFAPVIFTLTQ